MIDLYASIPGAPNFTYGELIASGTAREHGIDNTPDSDDIWNNLENLARNVLQPLRNKFGPLRLSSGYRCLQVNRLLKSSDTSFHLRGMAADIEPIFHKIKLYTVLEWLYFNCSFVELIAEYFPSGWVHIAYDIKYSNNENLKLMDPNHRYQRVSIEYIKNLYA